MKYAFGKITVIALGGSVVYPDEIDVRFLKQFKSFVERFVKRGRKVVLVVGGGRPARVYQKAASAVAPLTAEDKDWIGIHVTRLNAHLVRTIFRKIADPVVMDRPDRLKRLTRPVTVAGGWRPGWSTDYVAVRLAHKFRAKEVVIAGKPDAVYDKDPHKFRGAKRFSVMPWREYRRLIPRKWIPGASAPVDPVAAKFADKEGITAIVVRGKQLGNLQALLRGETFRGTIIRD